VVAADEAVLRGQHPKADWRGYHRASRRELRERGLPVSVVGCGMLQHRAR
jgi:hypothetical protein